MISPKQDRWYWKEWAKAHRADPDLDRHDIHLAALGYDRSHKEFTNEEFDLVIAEFLSISEPENLSIQIKLLKQPKVRLMYRINRLAPAAYVKELLLDRWGTSDLNDLSVSDLHQLRNTLKARSNAVRRRREQPVREEALAEANHPF